jgi:periplasmic copper chaperone A
MRSSRHCSRSRFALVGLLLVAATALLAGCGGGASQAPATPSLTVADAWVRPPMGPDRPAAGYLVITNTGGAADALLGATSPVSMRVELHETSMDSSGMAGMHPIDRLDIPAGATVRLEAGGYHLMLMDVGDKLPTGGTVELNLEFEKAGNIAVVAEVRGG